MEKDQNLESENNNSEEKENDKFSKIGSDESDENNKETLQRTPEEKILDLEDKLARAFAEMENQRRRFEKEKEEAYEYGGFIFAKEALNLIDNLERSKQILENDVTLKNSEALSSLKSAAKSINMLFSNKKLEIFWDSPFGKAVNITSTFFKNFLLNLTILGSFLELKVLSK